MTPGYTEIYRRSLYEGSAGSPMARTRRSGGRRRNQHRTGKCRLRQAGQGV